MSRGMETVLVLARIGLGAVFLAAGAAKLIDRAEFENNLPAFGVRWPGVARWVSHGLPVAEVVVGLMLIAGLLVNVAAGVAAGLLATFTAVVAVALARGRPVSCGCFGNVGRGKITVQTLMRNGLLLGLAVWAAGVRTEANPDPWWQSSMAGITAGATLLLSAQYLGLRTAFLPLPLPPHKSGIRWD